MISKSFLISVSRLLKEQIVRHLYYDPFMLITQIIESSCYILSSSWTSNHSLIELYRYNSWRSIFSIQNGFFSFMKRYQIQFTSITCPQLLDPLLYIIFQSLQFYIVLRQGYILNTLQIRCLWSNRNFVLQYL